MFLVKSLGKIDKYRDLAIELTSLRNMTSDVVPIVVGCLGCVTQILGTNLHKSHIYDFCKVEVLLAVKVLVIFY